MIEENPFLLSGVSWWLFEDLSLCYLSIAFSLSEFLHIMQTGLFTDNLF